MNMIFALYPRKVPPPIGFGALGLREQGASPKPPKTPKTPKTQLNKTNIKKMGLNGYFRGTQPHHASI